MKKSILVFSLCSLSVSTFAQVDSSKTNKNLTYCAELKDGILTIVSDQKKIKYDIKTSDGTIIKANGQVIRKDGISTVMKDGECIDAQGLMVSPANRNITGKEKDGKVSLKE